MLVDEKEETKMRKNERERDLRSWVGLASSPQTNILYYLLSIQLPNCSNQNSTKFSVPTIR